MKEIAIMRLFILILVGASALLAADSQDLSPAQVDEIIQKFAAKEAEFARARESYTYRETARVLDLDPGGATLGRWEIVEDIIFDKGGKRTEKVVRAPVATLTSFSMDQEDLDDLKNIQPFVLTTRELPKYLVRYLGKETLDEISCYAFAVKPKKLEPSERYFEGMVWVDDRDLQIVKSYGRAVGLLKRGGDHQFPKFETYREQVDGKYWFPTYTIANSTLHFKDNDARMRETVRYEAYSQFKTDTQITFGDEVVDQKDGKKPAEPPKKP
jgi:hypothetical protein